MTQDQPRPIDVTVHHHSDRCHIVAIKTRGRILPITTCRPERVEIIETALRLLATQQGGVLLSLLDSLPHDGVPGAEPEIHVTRAAGETTWTVATADRESVVSSLGAVGERVIDEVKRFADRAVVVYSDHNGLSARTPTEAAEDHRPSSPGGVWSQLMATDTERLVSDIDNLTEEQQ